MNDVTAIALVSAGVIGLLCILTGIAMINEPAALLFLGIVLAGGALAVAYVRGSE